MNLNKTLGNRDFDAALLVENRWHHRNRLELLYSVFEYIRYLEFAQFIFFFSREITEFLHIDIEISCWLFYYLGLLLWMGLRE